MIKASGLRDHVASFGTMKWKLSIKITGQMVKSLKPVAIRFVNAEAILVPDQSIEPRGKRPCLHAGVPASA